MLYHAGTEARSNLLIQSSPGAEMEDSVLLRGDGDAISHRRLKAPILQRRKELFVQLGAHAVEDSFTNNLSTLVNRDLDHHVSLRLRKLPRVNHGIHSGYGESRTNLVSKHGSTRHGSVRQPGGRAMAQV
jgi:hypothetical protein